MSGSQCLSDRDPELDVRGWLVAAVSLVGAPPIAVRALVLDRVARRERGLGDDG